AGGTASRPAGRGRSISTSSCTDRSWSTSRGSGSRIPAWRNGRSSSSRWRSSRPGWRCRGRGLSRPSWRGYTELQMSHLDDLDEYEAELELRLRKEYQAVFGLFRYCVLTPDATYLCNKLERTIVPQAAYPFFNLKLEDV